MNIRTLLLLATTMLAVPAMAQQAPTPASPAAPAATQPKADEAPAGSPLAAREQALAPVLSWMQALGVKLTYLGDEGGLSGYLAEDATGKMQTVYVTPDREHVVAGLLLKRGGDNITGVQVGEMRERFAKAAEQYVPKDGTAQKIGSESSNAAPAAPAQKADKENGESEPDPVGNSSAPPSPPVEKSEIPAIAPVPVVTHIDQPSPEKMAEITGAKAPAEAPRAAQPSLSLPAASGTIAGAVGNPAEIWISKLDKEKFLSEAAKVPYFEVGSMQAPITLYEIGDPQCPYCHATWDYIKPLIFDKKIKLRVILIAALNGSEPKVREILSSGLPARRWIESEAGKNLKLEMDQNSQPWKDSEGFLVQNMDFARQFGVDRTPFLGYVGFDGKFYSALGLPSDLGSFLSAATSH